jgi:hypothetical protein
MGPLNIFNSYQNQDKVLCLVYASLAGVCSLVSGIGQSGGFGTRRMVNIVSGICVGIVIGLFNFFVVFFAGCCTAFSHID